MAGKTFHGVGFDGETPSVVPNGAPAAEDASGEQYSGPTVVDEAKIEESLKRLRSLDQPPAVSIGEVSVSVVDAGSAEPTRIDDRPFVAPAKAPPLVSPGAAISRPTAVGHSVGPSVISQQNVAQLDPLRGTMFGHSIHLPDVATPETAPEELSSGALVVIPRPTAEEMQPFLPDRTTRPAQQHPQFAGVAQPLKRADLFHEPDTRTEVVSGFRQRIRGRTALVVVAVAAAAGMTFAWIYSRDGGGDSASPPPPPARVAVPPAPAAVVPPPTPPPAAEAVVPTLPAPPAVGVPANAQPEAAPAAARIEAGEAPRPRASAEDGTSKRSRRDRSAGPAIDDRALMPVAPVEAKAAEPVEAKAEPRALEPKAVELKAEPKTIEPKTLEPKAVELKAEPKAMDPKATEPKAKTGKKKKVELEEDPDATLPPSD